jgi:hypothetical protein
MQLMWLLSKPSSAVYRLKLTSFGWAYNTEGAMERRQMEKIVFAGKLIF